MQLQDHVYTLTLIISIFASFLVRKASTDLRRHLCFFLGVFLAICICGWEIWHSIMLCLGVIILNSLITARFIHYAIFFWGFSYLGFFHTTHYFGFSKPSPFSKIHFLLMILRVIGVSFEIHDTWVIIQDIRKYQNLTDTDIKVLRLKLKYKGVIVSSYDILSYAFSFIGMFTGPYYSCRTYNDMIKGWPSNAPALSAEPFLRRLYETPFFAIVYLTCSHFHSLDFVRSEQFLEHNFLFRFSYMNFLFFTYRMRMYCAWILAECSCMAAGLGAYPELSTPIEGEGPTNLASLDRWLNGLNSANKNISNGNLFSEEETLSSGSDENFYGFTTIHNVAIWKLEFTPTIRESLRSWNMTVQFWLANVIYRRFQGPKFIRSLLTMLTSAYWHGVDPGYYLSFLVVPFALIAEEGISTMIAFTGLSLPPGGLSFLKWLLKMSSFAYMSMGFLLLDMFGVMQFWSSLHYVMHAVIFTLVLLQLTFQRFVSPASLRAVDKTEGTHPMHNKNCVH